ncbi:DUF695 domain-containing protein [Nonomuraea sp. SBT364]|uniref:DUF695 domain-containing protein n=1 Tax=Nonomuraea sp. SBT364 TaxID=1580530 RepID=UPI00066DC1B3|nr:DUF695 domain-containing protein [Nonomuraea sp. SBT364]
MRLFGRKNGEDDSAERIAEFWRWWEGARPGLDAKVAAGGRDSLASLAETLAPAVSALHSGLVCEVAPGRNAAHALVVTAAGDAELRSLAHRWALAAPPADLVWEFHPSRQANPQAADLTLRAGDYEFGVGKLVLGLRVPRGAPRVDVSAYHPIFSELDDDTRLDAALLALDSVLGEDDVARWVGEITAVTFQPIDAVPAVHLPAVVADLASEFDGEQWVALEGKTARGRPLIAAARFPLRPVDHPLYDQHLAVTLPYAGRDGDKLPTGASVEALRDFEERLTRVAGDWVLAAHLSAEGHRIFHLYADPAGEVRRQVEELAATWGEGKARVDVAGDPAWSAVAAFIS